MDISKEFKEKISRSIENISTQLSVASTRITRLQQLMNELHAAIIDLDNELNDVSKLISETKEGTNPNARQ